MAFSDTQLRRLRAKLKPGHVKAREADGIALHYVEGWHVVAEANRIFGFDGWDRETVSSSCVWTKQIGNRFAAAYVTRVRIIVRAGEDRIIREGSGAGEANTVSPGQAHEFAAKAAETDATKRALSTFGNPFGLSLYSGNGDQANRKGATTTSSDAGAVNNATVMVSAPPANLAHAALPFADTAPVHGKAPTEAAALTSTTAAYPRAIATPGESMSIVAEPLRPIPSVPGAPIPDKPATVERRPVDKSLLAIPEPKRPRDVAHLRFVASQACIICGRQPTEAHHLKFTQPAAIGRKVSDEFTVSLCALHHREIHTTGNEVAWWERKRIDPVQVAGRL